MYYIVYLKKKFKNKYDNIKNIILYLQRSKKY